MSRSSLCRRAAITLIAVTGTVVALAAPAAAAPRAAKDSTPPPAPTHLSIDGRATSSSKASLTLAWTKSAASDVKGYNVYRNTTNSFSGSKRLVTLTTATSYKDATATPGGDYWYFVLAYDTSLNHGTPATLPVELSGDQTDRTLSTLVTDTKGTPLNNVEVDVYRGSSAYSSSSTDAHGFVAQHFLPYSINGLSVCVKPFGAGQGGLSSRGYVPGCYDGKSFSDPKHATRLSFAAGEFRSVSQAVTAGGEIKGLVNWPGGTGTRPATGATALLYDSDGDQVGDTYTIGDNGYFLFYGVPAGSNYTVEIQGNEQTGPGYADGIVDTWEGGAPGYSYRAGDARPSRVTAYSVTAGGATVAATLTPQAGALLTGTVTGSSDGDLEIFDSAGRDVFDSYLDNDSGASYTSIPLPQGDYSVCAYDYNSESQPACSNETTTYPWDGDPSDIPSAAAVHVDAQDTKTVNVSMPAYAQVVGAVNGPSTYSVAVYDDEGNAVSSDNEPGNSGYALTRVPAGTYTLCASDDSTGTGQCWTGDINGSTVPWNGDPSDLPSGAKDNTVLTPGEQITVDFNFGG